MNLVMNLVSSRLPSIYSVGFPGRSDGKASACDAGDPGSIPGLGISPGEGNGEDSHIHVKILNTICMLFSC